MPHSHSSTLHRLVTEGDDTKTWKLIRLRNKARQADDGTIRFMISDCNMAREACLALGNHDQANRYLDEACVLQDVLVDRHLSN